MYTCESIFGILLAFPGWLPCLIDPLAVEQNSGIYVSDCLPTTF